MRAHEHDTPPIDDARHGHSHAVDVAALLGGGADIERSPRFMAVASHRFLAEECLGYGLVAPVPCFGSAL